MTHSRRLIFLFLLLVCLIAKSDPWDRDSVAAMLSGRELDPIEGVWQFPADGAKVLISRQSASTFALILLDSPRLDAIPGTTIGIATITAASGKYDVKLDHKALGDPHIKGAQAILTVDEKGLLKIAPYKTGKKLNLRRWVPYLMRVVENNDTRPTNLDGARKTYPLTPEIYKPCL